MRKVSEVLLETLEDGGGTYDLFTLDPISADAWSVGIAGGDFPLGTSSRDLASLAAEYITAVKLAGDDGLRGLTLAFGTWVDEGRVHCDLVALVKSLDAALLLARATKQLAIYHLETEETVWLEEEK